MKSSQQKLFMGLMTVVLSLCIISCKKIEDPKPFIPERVFTPATITATSGETTATITWRASLFSAGKGVTYTLEVSKNADFSGTPAYTVVIDTTSVIVTDAQLQLKTDYYARVRGNATDNSAQSAGWVGTTTAFRITGEQLFLTIADADIKTTSVLLKWRATADLMKIVIKPATGAATDIPLEAADLTAAQKLVTGLTPTTVYTAELLKGTVSKGLVTFTTKTPSIYTVELNPTDNLVTAVANAANGDVIGLNPGTYDCKDGSGFAALVLQEKTVTIQSISGDPANTKVNFREITLKGTGAGITLKGIEFDGTAANTAGQQALYFINLTGPSSDAGAATFTNVLVDNCIIHESGNCILRGNRANANDHKINSIKFNNCVIYNTAAINNNYTLLQINKMGMNELAFTNSTLRNIGRGFIDWDAAVTSTPTILVDKCTINSVGQAALDYFLIDLSTNSATLQVKNSIIANAPMSGQTTGNNMMRITNATASMTNTNTFNLTNGATPTPVPHVFPGTLTQSANLMTDLGWTPATTNFTLPPASPLRTASSTGGPIGDPRWAN